MTPRLLPLPSQRSPILEWDTRHCRTCGRRRVHFRVKAVWRCIGLLPGGRSQRCGKRKEAA